MATTFVKGLDLSERFHAEVVRPLLTREFPGLEYSAALTGPGSEVLGFDTPESTDHDWGPRLQLFLRDRDRARMSAIDAALAYKLPEKVAGYAARFRRSDGRGETNGLEIVTVAEFFRTALGFDPTGETKAVDWLSVPGHCILAVTAGRVFHDGLGAIEPLRAKLAWYPRDVWLYLLAAQWRRIAQEEAFMGRCGQAGDDLGSRLIAARQVHDLMRLCFLMERRHTPYIKWLGTAFAQLVCSGELLPLLAAALSADSWTKRQTHLTGAYETAAKMHNALGITKPLPTKVSQYYGRPFLVIHADMFVQAIREAIASEEVRALPEHIGSADQFVDSTDALNHPEWFRNIWCRARERGDTKGPTPE